MSSNYDTGLLLYAIGLVISFYLYLFFTVTPAFGLAASVRMAMLLLFTVAFVAMALTTVRPAPHTVLLFLGVISYLSFLSVALRMYATDQSARFLVLGVSAALALGIGYLRHNRDVVLPRWGGWAVVALVLIGSAGLVAADATVVETSYELETSDNVTITTYDDGNAIVARDVGTVMVTNENRFRREQNLPALQGCVVGPNGTRDLNATFEYRRIRLDNESFFSEPDIQVGPPMIGPEETKRVRMVMRFHSGAIGTAEAGTYRVREVTDGAGCPDSADQPTIVLWLGG